MGIFNTMNVSASGLTAQRLRMDVISQNIANADTTRTEAGTPYRRKVAVFKEQEKVNFKNVFSKHLNKTNEFSGAGVEVVGIEEDKKEFNKVYNPAHPDANEEGYVLMPNVEVVNEMINLISASRAYEANVTAINSTKDMASKALTIGS